MPSKQTQAAVDPRDCGVGIRGVAMTIDSFVWFALLFVAVFPVAAITGDITTVGGETSADLEGTPATAAFALWLGLSIGYHTLLEWRFGGTAGKYLVGIRATNADGTPLTLRSSLVRNVARLVDFLPLLYGVNIALLATSERHRRLGDRLAGTAGVRT